MIEPVKSLCLDFPIREGAYLCQLVVPRDLSEYEARRLAAFVMTLAIPPDHFVAASETEPKHG
jgi:hypothetical protein